MAKRKSSETVVEMQETDGHVALNINTKRLTRFRCGVTFGCLNDEYCWIQCNIHYLLCDCSRATLPLYPSKMILFALTGYVLDPSSHPCTWIVNYPHGQCPLHSTLVPPRTLGTSITTTTPKCACLALPVPKCFHHSN
jgi:hypothetical protein